jgi:hypothetical protein
LGDAPTGGGGEIFCIDENFFFFFDDIILFTQKPDLFRVPLESANVAPALFTHKGGVTIQPKHASINQIPQTAAAFGRWVNWVPGDKRF